MMDTALLRVSFLTIIMVTVAVPGIQSANILFAPAMGEGSHLYVLSNVANELISRGHNITVLISGMYRDKYTSTNRDRFNYAFFKPNFTLDETRANLRAMTNAGLRGEYMSWMRDLLKTNFMDRKVDECATLLEDTQLMSELRDSKFTLAVVDPGFLCPVAQYLKHHYGVPYVALSPISTLSSAKLLHNRSPYNPSYMPELTSGLSDHLPLFRDRLQNCAYAMLLMSVSMSLSSPFEDIKKQHGISHMSSEYNEAELWLMNTNFAFDFPRPLLPNTITVGGLTTKPSKSLDQVSFDRK